MPSSDLNLNSVDMEFEARDGIYRSVCRACHGGCGSILYVKRGRLTRVKPNPDAPFNFGQMCVKGLVTPEMMYHPSRLMTPLKRKGGRGENRWKKVPWNDALGEIADKIQKIKDEIGSEAIALGQGTGRHHFMHVIRFANSLGTPNWYEPGLANCLLPRITVSQLTYGGFPVADYYGKVPPKTILFWGHNPVVSGPDGELPFPVKKALNSGSFGIAVDPRRSETGKRCKMWLPIRPGTDAALALAMIHVIINDDLYDKEFVDKWTVGFDRLKDHVAHYTPAWAEKITWVPAEKIVAAAEQYSLEKPSVLEWGVAMEHNINSLQTVRAIALLRGLTGNIDVPGGDMLGMRLLRPYPVLKEKLPKGMVRKRIGSNQFKLLSGFRSLIPSAHIPGLFRAIREGDPYPIEALLIFGGNPMLTVANSRNVYEALLRLDLLVVMDMFMTPTAALADYVLPAASWPEVNQIVEMPMVAENAVFAQQKVAQYAQCRQDEEVMIDLARRLDLPGAEDTLEDILNYRLEPLDLTFSDLKDRFVIFPKHEYRKYEKKGFRTPSGRVELFCRSLERLGYDPLPVYKEPPESPVSRPEIRNSFPYILITGSRRMEFFHSEHRQSGFLRRRRPEPKVEIHPETARRNRIGEGDWIYVISPRGKIRMRARLTEDIHINVINVDHGWWFPEMDPPDFGVWESNANILTSDEPPYDPAFGTYQLRGLLCNIRKALE